MPNFSWLQTKYKLIESEIVYDKTKEIKPNMIANTNDCREKGARDYVGTQLHRKKYRDKVIIIK